ncbi:molybdopterin-guanine dinucleotide biosynthesis protein A [Allocatelliglobosispora scoriae]|uniref:Molybdopterin-guanine dinucleotide biosynthesis protein A n=1 Tax=Allocatelliglobosispora scoriae TaxID=643052 RepID=A0A841BW29_9ACTN|nr:molybdenum cofactor guanylyltransferase [Allocatelliglobosispora scoriae]MBB5870941.1 molybdopterin-guanine dinucleotide biosynthesis protein A [Allocatelliglobosispora scoriae]
MDGFAVIVLAGGAARRLGGLVKPLLPVGGTPMLLRVLGAAEQASPRVVVGPSSLAAVLPPDVLLTCEDPPGGGPVAGIGAAVAGLDGEWGGGEGAVGVLAGDLPFVSGATLDLLRGALAGAPTAGVALLLDPGGRRQSLLGVWRTTALRAALSELGELSGRSLRELLSGVDVVEVPAPAELLPSYLDCDTDEDWQLANRMGN